MKRLIAVILCAVIMASFVAACGGSEMTLSFSFGQRTGRYSGDTLNGLPHGEGKFVADEGWTYEGQFVNGHMEGEGQTTWEDGSIEIGTYVNDVIVPLSGDDLRALYSSPHTFVNRVVEFVGQVYQDPLYTGEGATLQVYGDINNSTNRSTVNYNNTGFKAEYDNYVRVLGLVTEVDVDTDRPIIQARSVEVLTYIEAVVPTIAEIVVNEKREQHGYAVTLQKIEFAEAETRVYLKVENNGISGFNLYSWNAIMIRGGVQHSEQPNWFAKYPEVETGLKPGAITEGIFVFPAVEPGAVNLIFDASTEDWAERIKPYDFDVNDDGSVNEPPDPVLHRMEINETREQKGYSVTLQKVEFLADETLVYIKVDNNGASDFNIYSWGSFLVQNGVQHEQQRNYDEDYPQIQSDLKPGASSEGIIAFPAIEIGGFQLLLDASGEWSERIKTYEFDVNDDGSVNEPVDPVLHRVEVGLSHTQRGYTVTVERIEFLANETLVYLTVENDGAANFNLYSFNARLLQGGRQYEEQRNWDEGYPEVQTGLMPGITTEGIIAFPAIEVGSLQLTFGVSSSNYRERLTTPIKFDIELDGNGNLVD